MVMTLTENGSQRLFGELVTKGYFGALGISPAKAVLPSSGVGAPGSAPVAVLSYNAWKIRFDGSPDVLGKILDINGTSFTVIGVAPEGFLGVSAVFGPDVWLPATMAQRCFPLQCRTFCATAASLSFKPSPG